MTKKSKSESTPSKQTVLFQSTDAIEISLFIEKKALGFYEKAANNVSYPRVKDMFTRLAEEEREHIQTLQTKVRFLQPAISGKEKTCRHLELFVSNELKGKVVPVSETKVVQKFKSGMDALEFGIESEKCSYRNFIQSVGKQKETGCESYFFAFDGCGKKHLALLLRILKKKI